jgi:predicted GIY-YIG superfamily endonuclease
MQRLLSRICRDILEGKRMVKRDTYLYHLKRGRKISYTGITNDPKRREHEHRSAGRHFRRMAVHPYPTSRETALKREKKYKK